MPEAGPGGGNAKAQGLSARFGDPESCGVVVERVLAEGNGSRAPGEGVFERLTMRSGTQIVAARKNTS